MMLESNVWDENSFLFIHTTWIGNDLLKIRKMNSAELILKTAYSSAIALAAILKTRSARRLARCLLPAFLCAHIFIKRETSGYEAVSTCCFEMVFLYTTPLIFPDFLSSLTNASKILFASVKAGSATIETVWSVEACEDTCQWLDELPSRKMTFKIDHIVFLRMYKNFLGKH